MKATDLMIGDWILVQDAPNAGFRPCRVTIGLLHNLLISNETKRSVMPLRLTPEFLEKSGFEKTEESPLSKYYRKCLCENTILIIECHVRANYVNIYCHPNGDTFGISASIKDCYVHELQHALKLCGIEKEIKICE